MSKSTQSTRQILAEHSAAKVNVLTYYLGIYLSILGKVPAIRRVHLFDLMCGEGEYADGRQGSALAGPQQVLRYFTDYPNESLHVTYILNDAGMSDIDPSRRKIDRVEERVSQLVFPATPDGQPRITLHYRALPCDRVMQQAIDRVQRLSAFEEKALLFIDPWGYKDIRIADLRAALVGGQSEVLLFLPTEMMYRFANKAYHDDFSGGEALQQWLKEVFPEQLPRFANVHDFINQLRHRLQNRLEVPYSSRFTLETAGHNTYSLFFFTSNRRGLEKMLEAQWMQDPTAGSGHRLEQTFTLFKPGELENYPAKLVAYLAAAPSRTNEDLLEFGLAEGFLPKHTNEVLRKLQATGRLHVSASDGQNMRKGAFYLNNPDRMVRFSLTS
ncbi:three-Cys-motif partner protein TcmP [Hymenobacter gummosus]|uniref:Three-Cys-motif partner protein TcmP n=1 Tax=Hymenobacter gummosus TaxID=1776032 RepID=A0A3S0JJN2_9BACT|nr:three-Cys-motif partner protein TcmP [Hymenobacter gummosus]RTQ52379.1 three-Cys-motif partner protein TcmP [Hymenobacter gummosus]